VIDSHCHVHDAKYDDDRDAMIARARGAGIEQMIAVGCDMADTQRAIDAARTYELYASAGIHPHEAQDAPEDLAAAFSPFLDERRVVAIGETGLDYYYDHSPRDTQAHVLRAQIAIARDAGLPLIFHQRDAFDDFIAILREEWRPGMRGVIHCFTGDTAQARTFVDEFGLKLGIGGVVTFKTAQTLRDAVQAVGLEPLILETDAPYLAPVPMRGKRNEPAYMTYTADAIADLLERPRDEIIATTQRTTRALFNL
jgi:TatD DNase family protein